MSDEFIKSSRGNETHALLRERDLADRWKVSSRTLQRWRAEDFGPAWISIGGSIRYRLGDILAYEARNRQGDGADL